MGAALRAAGCRVLYFAAYRKPQDVFHRQALEAAADTVVWCCEAARGIAPERPQDRAFRGNVVQALQAHGLRVALVPEHLRAWCLTAGRAPQAHEQAAIAAEQDRQIDAARASGVDVVVADTTGVVVAAYSAHYFADVGLWPAALQRQRTVDLTLTPATADLDPAAYGRGLGCAGWTGAADGWLAQAYGEATHKGAVCGLGPRLTDNTVGAPQDLGFGAADAESKSLTIRVRCARHFARVRAGAPERPCPVYTCYAAGAVWPVHRGGAR